MKKYIIGIIALLVLLPRVVYAIDYDITDYYIDAKLQENGNMEVEELLVLDGSFNGYIRDIVYKNSSLTKNDFYNNTIYNATNLSMHSIKAKRINQKVSYDTLEDTDFITLKRNLGSEGGFLENPLTDGKSYKMYFASDEERVAIKLSYTLEDVVVMHEDIAEVYWTFIGSDYDDTLRNVNIRVHLPNVDTSDAFLVWAHGDLAGEVKRVDNQYIEAYIKKVDANSSIDIRTTFAKSLLNEEEIAKKSNQIAKEEILKVEMERAEEANQKRKEYKTKYYAVLIGTILWYVALIFAWIYVFIKYDKEYKNTLGVDYYREFIEDYNVEVIDYLFHKGITPNALSASILNLIYKKNISVIEIESKKKKKEYKFTLENKENVNDTENYLISFLFEKVGHENNFTTKDLQDYAKSTKTCDRFSTSYTTWKNKVVQDGEQQNFYEKKAKAIFYGVLFLVLSILLNMISVSIGVINLLTLLTGLASFIFLIYTIAFTKRTKKGSEHYYKWKAFKRFLLDFGNFKEKELPEITLWERYLVYATVFGIADEVNAAMNVKIKELELDDTILTTYYPTYMHYHMYRSINESINHAINLNTTAITQERVNSSMSSGSGFGGGFSSGSGFGGGGGGGRGF